MKARGILLLIVLILAMIQDQALVASKHFLVQTEDKNLADNAVGDFDEGLLDEVR